MFILILKVISLYLFSTPNEFKMQQPSNADLKISMKTKTLGTRNASASIPPSSAFSNDLENLIQIKSVLNNLPYSCIIEIIPPTDIDWVYYAALDSKGTKLFYKSEYPTEILPSFSIYDLNTDEATIQFVCWPVKNEVIGSPSYFGPISLNPNLTLGTYDLEVEFKKPADIQLFQQVKPLIEKHYGKVALPGIVKIEEANHDVYLPSLNIIKLSKHRNNLIHELIHAARKQLLFANKAYKFDEETEIIEEFFAEGLSNMIKDDLNLMPNNYLKEGAVYGSTLGYNYDFRIKDKALVSQNLQSSWGGILTLENSRYFLASETFHKIAIEYFLKTGQYFAKDFNQLYFNHVKHTLENPSRTLFFNLCEALLPMVECTPTKDWLASKLLFNAKIIKGVKIFMHINDYYTAREWLGITHISLYETFANGSEWVNGNERYSMNGKTVKVELIHVATGQIEHVKEYQIPHYENGFGSIKLYFHHLAVSQDTEYFQRQDKASNIESFGIKIGTGLYQIRLSAENITKSYYRIMGQAMFDNKDKIMIANPFKTGKDVNFQLLHINKKGVETFVDTHEFSELLGVAEVPFINNKNCEPGILHIMVNGGGLQQNFQRNIGYGGDYGGHQFLIGSERKAFLAPKV